MVAATRYRQPTYRGRLPDDLEDDHRGAHHFQVPRWLRLREEIDLWCTEHFGERRMDGCDRWFQVGASWLIYSDDDAMAFRLRWC